MQGVKVFLKRVSYVVLPVAGLGALLVRFPSLHNGLVKPDKLDWNKYGTDLNKRAQMGKDEWKPVHRLYPSLDFSKQKTHKLSAADFENKHFTHVYQTIQDEQLADRLSRYITKWDASESKVLPITQFRRSNAMFCDGRWRAFLERLRQNLNDPKKLCRLMSNCGNNNSSFTENLTSDLNGSRVHYSITDFSQDTQPEGKPRLGVLIPNGWPCSHQEWAILLSKLRESEAQMECPMTPVFVIPSTNYQRSSNMSMKMMRRVMKDMVGDEFENYIVIDDDLQTPYSSQLDSLLVNTMVIQPLINAKKQHIQSDLLISDLISWSAQLFEIIVDWSSLSDSDDIQAQSRIFDEIIFKVMLSFTNETQLSEKRSFVIPGFNKAFHRQGLTNILAELMHTFEDTRHNLIGDSPQILI